ncbi:MAG: ROK family protein [Armatimonadetes bacterium]|nr:ROK family protein [Armatimonadota bacterium]
MQVLGIDIGGTGIKGAPVDTRTGKMLADRFRVATPDPATPDAVIEVLKQMCKQFSWKDSIGCTFPSVVKDGRVFTAVHLDPSWVGLDAEKELSKKLKRKFHLLNDADAAALAEARFGAGKDLDGLLLMVTLGTGLGTGIVYKGTLIPNAELGHVMIRGKDAEMRASNSAREKNDWSWKKYGKRVNEYVNVVAAYVNPDRIVIGGGVIKEAEKFLYRVKAPVPVVAATLGNEAGIIGAAIASAERVEV